MTSLEKQTAIVVGGAGGIGEGIVRLLCRSGIAVTINHTERKRDRARQMAEELVRSGGAAIAVEGDITKEADVSALVDETVKTFGGVQILVNCAGFSADGLAANLSLDDFERTVRVNLTGTFLTTREVLKHMVPAGYGRIINISSVVGLSGLRGGSAYAASKAAIIGFSKSVAREVARKGITVNVICPGYINAGLAHSVPDEILGKIVSSIPQGKMGEADDIGAGVLYLASREAGYVTGEVHRIDGGYGM